MKREKDLVLEAVVRPAESQFPLVHHLYLKCSLPGVIGLAGRGFCCTTHNGHSLGLLLYILLCPMLWRYCCFEFVGFVGVGQLLVLFLGLGGSWAGQSARFPSLPLPGRPLQPSSASASRSKEQGGTVFLLSGPWVWLTHTHLTRASSTDLFR